MCIFNYNLTQVGHPKHVKKMHLSGQVAANIDRVETAKEIIDQMMEQACSVMRYQASRILTSKL